MKKYILILITLTTLSCANKPRMLSGEIERQETSFCMQLTIDTEQKQNLYQITGFRNEIHKYDKHYYYYYLSDYLSSECPHNSSYMKIKDAKVGIVFQTYSKGHSYLKLVFNLNVDLYHQSKLILSKSYHTSSKTDVMFFTDSNDKQAELVSKALSKGYQDILNQILEDVKSGKLKDA